MNRILVLSILISAVISWNNSFAQSNSSPIYRKGIEYASEGKFKEAAGWFEGNLKDNISDSISISSLAVIKDLGDGKITDRCARSFFSALNFIQNGKTDEALKELERAIEFGPGYPKSYNVAGMICASLGDKSKAIGYFKKAIEINPQYNEACFNLAVLYQSSSEPQEALKYYEKTVSLKPDSPEAVVNIAAIYASIGKYPDAIKYYQRAIHLDPDDPGIYYNLALAYFMSEQLTKFKDNLLKAQELYQRKGDARGLEKVSEYMGKIKEIESKVKQPK